MKKSKQLQYLSISIVCVIVVALLAMPAPAAAATTLTKTYTETQINSSYRVTHPLRWRVTNLRVDLQAGQAVISATHEYRSGKTVSTTTVLVPTLTSGRLYWNVVSFTYNDKSVSQEVINQINTSINNSWRNWFRGKLPAGKLTSVAITDADITFVAVK